MLESCSASEGVMKSRNVKSNFFTVLISIAQNTSHQLFILESLIILVYHDYVMLYWKH